jgi:diacylglycerol kinase (ATP)
VATTERVEVIVNLTARGLREAGPLRHSILAAAADAGARVHETRSLEDLDRVASRIAARGVDAVVLAGGDGSHMNGLSALWRAWPRGVALPAIALAPGGTVGTVARNLGMRGRAPRRAERVVRAACDGAARRTPTPTLLVSDDRGGLHVGFIFGAGLVARFFDLYYAAARPGLATAAGIVARVFAGAFVGASTARFVLDPAGASLSVDRTEQAARRWSLVLASVVPDLGLGMRATYRAGERHDRFHVVGSGLPPRELAAQLPRVLAGKPLTGEPRVDALAGSLDLAFDDPGGSYVLDGDVFRARAVRVTPGPVIAVVSP